MMDDIPILAALSEADLESHRVRARCDAIPLEIDRHAKELTKVQKNHADYEIRLEDFQRERRGLERDADQAKARRREVELKQFRVKNNVEHQALTKEIDDMRRRASDFEDDALQILSDEEAAEAEITRLAEIIERESGRVAEIRSRLEAELAGLQKERATAEARRNELVERLSPKTRVRYDRVLRSKGDMAVVGVAEGSCGGCYYQLPPQRLNEIKKGEVLVVCEACGRMVVGAKLVT